MFKWKLDSVVPLLFSDNNIKARIVKTWGSIRRGRRFSFFYSSIWQRYPYLSLISYEVAVTDLTDKVRVAFVSAHVFKMCYIALVFECVMSGILVCYWMHP